MYVVLRGGTLFLCVLVLVGYATASPLPTAAASWQQLPLKVDGKASLMTPASGALFVGSEGGLQRSDDGGQSWHSVTMPFSPPRGGHRLVAVDPTNHQTVFADGADGLYRSTDDAVSWQLVRPGGSLGPLAISPVDPSLVYVVDDQGFDKHELLRSQDGGTSWESVHTFTVNLFSWINSARFLRPDPLDANEVFLSVIDLGFNGGGWLYRSSDRGATWDEWGPASERHTMALAGGFPSAPNRRYAVVRWLGDIDPALRGVSSQRDARMTWEFERSDDGATTWTSTDPPDPIGASQRRGPGRVAAPLVVDPAAPDRLFAVTPDLLPMMSQDGGVTWAPLGDDAPGSVVDLALGVDGANVYALTSPGEVFRLRLR